MRSKSVGRRKGRQTSEFFPYGDKMKNPGVYQLRLLRAAKQDDDPVFQHLDCTASPF